VIFKFPIRVLCISFIIDQEPAEGEQTLTQSLAASKPLKGRTQALGNSRPLELGDAKIHAFLDIEQKGTWVGAHAR
jgi:hypothetical protein